MKEYTLSKALDQRLRTSITSELESPWHQQAETRLMFASAYGAYLEDLDGNRYIDFSNGLGAVLLGHNDLDVNSRLIAHLHDQHDVLVSPTALHAELAEQLISDLGEDYQVAFFPSGTAAVRAAMSLLKVASGKDIILSAGYHGWDPCWAPGLGMLLPNAHGVVDFFFCLDFFETLITRYHTKIAGVVISPDYLYLEPGWYTCFFDICDQAGLPVVADDVKQGYRYGAGSSLKTVGHTADTYVFSKCLANGHAIAAMLGPQNMLRLARDMVTTGLHTTIPFVAANETLRKLKRLGGQAKIKEQGDKFLQQVRKYAKESLLPLEIVGGGNLFQFVFGDVELERAFYTTAIEQGLIFFLDDNQCPSLAFAGEVIEEAQRAIAAVMHDVSHMFKYLHGKPIPSAAYWRAAFQCMEGFPDCSATSFERENFLQRQVFGKRNNGVEQL